MHLLACLLSDNIEDSGPKKLVEKYFSHGTFLYFSWYLENSVYLVVLFLEIKNFAFGAVNHQQLRLVLGLDFFFFFSQLRFFPRTDSGIRPNTQNLN